MILIKAILSVNFFKETWYHTCAIAKIFYSKQANDEFAVKFWDVWEQIKFIVGTIFSMAFILISIITFPFLFWLWGLIGYFFTIRREYRKSKGFKFIEPYAPNKKVNDRIDKLSK